MGSYSSILNLMTRLALCLAISFMPNSAEGDDYLSIKFSKKNQLRTGMLWIRLKPNLILAQTLLPMGVGVSDESFLDLNSGISEVTDFGQLPYSAAGRLFFTRPDGKVATCSGAFAGRADLILTAAHCVMSLEGDWNRDFLFIRAYGTDRQDVFAIECVAAPANWGALSDQSLYRYDYAFLRATRNSQAGSLGITNGQPPDEVKLVGYANNYFEGRRMLELDVPTFIAEDGLIGSENNPLGKGSSGSPWLGLSTVFTVTSYVSPYFRQNVMGPRLSLDALHLVNYAGNGCEAA
jgi:V8-like Glu-specific endopeptidase